eukprot:GHVQ01006819.1.p1 GENE.GHVQ01006819.1~~GHVQ01006819.1.p1  ORF type:complete len:259 (-),score=34.41 GHVQ01006819.1:896-1672(-)
MYINSRFSHTQDTTTSQTDKTKNLSKINCLKQNNYHQNKEKKKKKLYIYIYRNILVLGKLFPFSADTAIKEAAVKTIDTRWGGQVEEKTAAALAYLEEEDATFFREKKSILTRAMQIANDHLSHSTRKTYDMAIPTGTHMPLSTLAQVLAYITNFEHKSLQTVLVGIAAAKNWHAERMVPVPPFEHPTAKALVNGRRCTATRTPTTGATPFTTQEVMTFAKSWISWSGTAQIMGWRHASLLLHFFGIQRFSRRSETCS